MKTFVLASCTSLQPQLWLSVQSSFGTRSPADLLFTKSFRHVSVLISGFYSTSRCCTPSKGPSIPPAAVWLYLQGLPVPLICFLHPLPSRCGRLRPHSQPSSPFLLHLLAIPHTSTASPIGRMSVFHVFPVLNSLLSNGHFCLRGLPFQLH